MMKGRMVAVLIRTCCGFAVEKPDGNPIVSRASGFLGASNRGRKVYVVSEFALSRLSGAGLSYWCVLEKRIGRLRGGPEDVRQLQKHFYTAYPYSKNMLVASVSVDLSIHKSIVRFESSVFCHDQPPW